MSKNVNTFVYISISVHSKKIPSVAKPECWSKGNNSFAAFNIEKQQLYVAVELYLLKFILVDIHYEPFRNKIT
jgi:hypothetical protein